MALHVQLAELPRPHDVTHSLPPPRLDCASHESRQANDYVRTPCHVIPPNGPRIVMDSKRIQYHASTTDSLVSTPEPEVRTPHEPPKDQELHLPSKQNGGGGSGGGGGGTGLNRCTGGASSICPRCHRCRCEKCRSRRELPRRWCGGWECSADSTLDCVTCMCCIRGTFYHCCSEAEEDRNFSDNPCGCCDYPKCLARWVFIIVATLFLPCLILYWPLTGALALVTDCYNRCGPVGCRCNQQQAATRPLIEAENCSA